MKIGRISFLNADPFFYSWKADNFPLVTGAPRPLATAARRGEVMAGPLPVVECWELEREFSPLRDWGIAVRRESGSVFVLSKKPFSKLNGAMLGLTQDSSTSVVLCKVLLEQKHGLAAGLRRGFHPSDDGRLVIGDEALWIKASQQWDEWPFVTDLATEWWDWMELPFVFARWIARTDIPAPIRLELETTVARSLASGLAHLGDIARIRSAELRASPAALADYLKSFIYQLGPQEEESIQTFRSLVEKSSLLPV